MSKIGQELIESLTRLSQKLERENSMRDDSENEYFLVPCECEYDCLAETYREKDGKWIVSATNLPACTSYGNTKQEALENIKEAFELLVESYTEEGQPIPWYYDRVSELQDNHEQLSIGRFHD